MIDHDYLAAKRVLSGTGLCLLDAARLMREAVELCGEGVNRIREGLRLGALEMERRECSVSFEFAVEAAITAKSHRRPRTLSDIRQLMKRLMKKYPDLADRSLRSINADECREMLENTFLTPRQRFKARTVLGGIFSIGRKRGWCSCNPVEAIDPPALKEKEIKALSLQEVERLLLFARYREGGSCAAAAGLMIYAGIRPQEVVRLTWGDINLVERVVSLRPRHSKTGGTRHVSIQPVLAAWLNECQLLLRPDDYTPICPKNWRNKWKQVRIAAGWDKGILWQQDCLRHTYASYHAKYFSDYSLLQAEMGHGSSSLLRTRYLNMSGVTKSCASTFWNPSIIRIDDFAPAPPQNYLNQNPCKAV